MRSEPLMVWPDAMAVPDKVREYARRVRLPDRSLRDFYVDVRGYGRELELVMCDGFFDWHDDKALDVTYSYLLVVRNDTGSYVETKRKKVRPQPAGTIVRLPYAHQHRLGHRLGCHAPSGVWLALGFDTDDLLPLSKIIEEFTARIDRFKPTPATGA